MAITKPPTVVVAEDPSAGCGPSLPLPDGRIVRLRPVRCSDGVRTLRVAPSCAARIPLSFLTVDPGLVDQADRLLRAGGHDRTSVVGTIGHRLVAIGCADRAEGSDRAEVTVVVAEGLRGLGLERALFGVLAAQVGRRGTTTVVPVGGSS